MNLSLSLMRGNYDTLLGDGAQVVLSLVAAKVIGLGIKAAVPLAAAAAQGIASKAGRFIANKAASATAKATSGIRRFAHGGPGKALDSIVSDGVKPVSMHTHMHPAGSFFTHELSDPMGLEAAAHWAAHRGGRSGKVGILEMPTDVVEQLEAQGLVRTGQVPGLPFFPKETVWHPDALPTINQYGTWRILE